VLCEEVWDPLGVAAACAIERWKRPDQDTGAVLGCGDDGTVSAGAAGLVLVSACIDSFVSSGAPTDDSEAA
jgi:hypothetical protein